MTTTRSAGRTLYARVRDELRDELDSGALRPGDRLPTELELAARFGVNRLTIRQAIGELAREGRVAPRQGSGTYVTRKPAPYAVELNPTAWAVEVERATNALESEGRTIGERLLAAARLPAPPNVAEHLGAGDALWLESLISQDDDPMIRCQYWVATDATVDDAFASAAGGFGVRALRELAGSDMFYSWRSFDAIAATTRDADLLEVAVGSPLLRRAGVNSDASGRPVLYVQRDAPGSRMRIVMRNAAPQQ